jgi:hypothetical protein
MRRTAGARGCRTSPTEGNVKDQALRTTSGLHLLSPKLGGIGVRAVTFLGAELT